MPRLRTGARVAAAIGRILFAPGAAEAAVDPFTNPATLTGRKATQPV